MKLKPLKCIISFRYKDHLWPIEIEKHKMTWCVHKNGGEKLVRSLNGFSRWRNDTIDVIGRALYEEN